MNGRQPKRILVVANQTVGGRALIDAVREKAEQAHEEHRPFEVFVVCPQNLPRKGSIVYDQSVWSAAENRLKMTIAHLREVGIEAHGEVMDPDPYSATMDAVAEWNPEEIVISTHPETRSGWMRKDLVERVRDATDVPVEHVVVDLDREREDARHTLVVANQTVGGEPLIRLLKEKAQEEPHTFIVICPQGEGQAGDAHARLAHTLDRLEHEGLEAVGQVMDPDPYTAIQNALDYYTIDEIVISTFPETRSGWLRGDLVGRVQSSTSKPVEHVVVTEEEAHEGERV
jgi:hypothetical protein